MYTAQCALSLAQTIFSHRKKTYFSKKNIDNYHNSTSKGPFDSFGRITESIPAKGENFAYSLGILDGGVALSVGKAEIRVSVLVCRIQPKDVYYILQ